MKKILAVMTICTCLLGSIQTSKAGMEWTLKKQFAVDSATLDVALSQDGKWLFVLAPGEVLIYQTEGEKIIARIPVEKTFDTISHSAANNTLILAGRTEKVVRIIRLETVHEFSYSSLAFKGPENAPVTIAVFSDYQCPYCGRIEAQLEQVLGKYPNDVKLVFKNFPLPMHPFADEAAAAALAAHRQGKFWEFHHKLFEASSSLSDAKIQDIAKELGLAMEKFNRDLKDKTLQDLIARDIVEGTQAEVGGTPTLFINGKIVASRSFDGFQQMIEEELKKKK